jgi:hypothetical protein
MRPSLSGRLHGLEPESSFFCLLMSECERLEDDVVFETPSCLNFGRFWCLGPTVLSFDTPGFGLVLLVILGVCLVLITFGVALTTR